MNAERPTRPDNTTITAWLGIIFCGGSNAVAIRVGNVDLEPFWGATLRFGLAAAFLLALMLLRGAPLPRGQTASNVFLYGLLNFAGSYAFLYWGLVEATAAAAQVAISAGPIMTLLMAAGIGLEQFSWRRLAGTIIASAGILVVFRDQLVQGVSLVSLLALLAGSLCIAAAGVAAKKLPPGHPLSANAFAMLIGSIILGLVSLLASEEWSLPSEARTWASLMYLIVVGSVGLFSLFLFVITRWSATATSYALLPMPLVTATVAAIVLGERITRAFLVGGALVLGGVCFGVFTRGGEAMPSGQAGALE
jgi:drug/metabolite transporter (DMT)-like permease